MIFDINLKELSDEDIYEKLVEINEKIAKASAAQASADLIYQMQDIGAMYKNELIERQTMKQWEDNKNVLEKTIESDPQFEPKEEKPIEDNAKTRKRIIV